MRRASSSLKHVPHALNLCPFSLPDISNIGVVAAFVLSEALPACQALLSVVVKHVRLCDVASMLMAKPKNSNVPLIIFPMLLFFIYNNFLAVDYVYPAV